MTDFTCDKCKRTIKFPASVKLSDQCHFCGEWHYYVIEINDLVEESENKQWLDGFFKTLEECR